jgi:ABC-type multidrug transport system fused ATPase/permease subunit
LERNGSIVQRFKRSVSKRFSARASAKKKHAHSEKDAEAAAPTAAAAEDAAEAARKKKADEDEAKLPKVNLSRLFYENRTEWPFILVGIIASIFMGAIMPIFAILFGNILGVISYEDEQKARDESGFYAVMFFLLGLGSCTAQFLQGFMFAVSGEILTSRMRRKAFTAMLKQVGLSHALILYF